jgi:hypothetical protein
VGLAETQYIVSKETPLLKHRSQKNFLKRGSKIDAESMEGTIKFVSKRISTEEALY